MAVSRSLLETVQHLRAELCHLRFGPPVSQAYNPLDYAWAPHALYLRRYGRGRKRVLFLGMNPGPFGMVQTGVPFGQVRAVQDWLGIDADVRPPATQHPKRPVAGFACCRNEISGERLWGLFARRFGTADAFFRDHFVLNYCPLAFVEESGRNLTPDKLPRADREALFAVCDDYLSAVLRILNPEWLIGVGAFAARRAQRVVIGRRPLVARILHPSPASPAANLDWARRTEQRLEELGVWERRTAAAAASAG
jgi:single-strand selective monofunctional uracil DNA glycosylase